jgi:hypothetical protein
MLSFLGFARKGGHVEMDEDDALEAADIEAATPKERADFDATCKTWTGASARCFAYDAGQLANLGDRGCLRLPS